MGYRVSWIARSGTGVDELLGASGRRVLTGERHDFPDIGFYLLDLSASAEKPWVVLIGDGTENVSALEESHAQSLSKGDNETLYFWCSDTVMATVLSCFRGGKFAWSIEYDCNDASKQPALEGDVPVAAHEILNELREKQRTEGGADFIYDLTAELGRVLVGFRHDMCPETDDPEPFQVLSK